MLSRGCSNVVLSFLLQSERFFQTDQLIIKLQVAVVTNFFRMFMGNVTHPHRVRRIAVSVKVRERCDEPHEEL